MKTKILSFIILSFGIVCLAAIVSSVLAQTNSAVVDITAPNIQYPVAELGNCKNKEACEAYCDISEHVAVCVAFAGKNNLFPKEELEMAKKWVESGSKGPGGCYGQIECDAYCQNINHMDECIAFAEKIGLMRPQELAEAKKVQAAIKRGVKPPPCNGKKECDAYCDSPDHMEECINFGVEAGFIQGKELEDSQKMLAALKRGVKPLPCKGKEACDEYCQNPDNMEKCMNFAIEAGFMDEKQKEDSQKMLQAIKKGVKPPNCKGKEECDAFCQSEEHMEECINFSVAAGMMTEKDAEMAKKTKGKGPGGCKSKEECDAFCKDNQEECFKFGVENGMIPPEELQKIEQGKQNFKQTFSNLPPEVESCLKESVGSEQVEKFKTGEMMPPREMGDKMRECFEKSVKPMGPPCEGENCPPPGTGESGAPGMPQMAPGTTGPGGCKTPEDCKAYCESNPEECKNFAPGPGAVNPGGQTMPQQAGPGGCKGPEECKAFCEQSPDQCKNFQPGGPQPEGQGPGIFEKIKDFENGVKERFFGGPEGKPGEMPPEGTMAPPGTPIPSGQYSPSQYTPPTGPGVGGGIAPGEMGPGPGTAPPGDVITPPEGSVVPPSDLGGFTLQILSGMFRLLLEK